ncbi:hypothetical protein ACFQBQ_06010 [Granulicella cerasi]|uniref:Uncharacterized protein n=1 Tax=Granulicella cerasi TaxID=741063 RepID=A0ABW1Z8B2_9BACT|nr:hypothetical protein [Granulicella cerasi]
MTAEVHLTWPATWSAKVLRTPPLIAPARQFMYPQYIPGEEDAMTRGAMLVEVKPASGGTFLATCARGFESPSLPSGVWSCPNADAMLAVAGGYAYLIHMIEPAKCLHVEQRPVTEVLVAQDAGLILLAGFQNIVALNASGVAWTSARLTWEGITLGEVRDGSLHGTGWNMMDDRDVPFVLDLATGQHTGGGF